MFAYIPPVDVSVRNWPPMEAPWPLVVGFWIAVGLWVGAGIGVIAALALRRSLLDGFIIGAVLGPFGAAIWAGAMIYRRCVIFRERH